MLAQRNIEFYLKCHELETCLYVTYVTLHQCHLNEFALPSPNASRNVN